MKKYIKRALLNRSLSTVEKVVISVSCEKMIDSMNRSKKEGNKFSEHEEVAYNTLKSLIEKIK